MQDHHLQQVGFFRKVKHPTEGEIVQTALPSQWSGTQPSGPEPAPAPRLGQHTVEVLRQAGITAQEIDAMVKSGVVQVLAD
jgi:crotonobetainyl-CoA:carnitine CoA-transferase CaiB-like acyl-CoA transferase